MQYHSINIGPIISTFGMARKPRELWAASFLFSHLMKCIYQEAEKAGSEIISPAKPQNEINKVGIYPDRIYFRGDVNIKELITGAVWAFYEDLLGKNSDKGKALDISYFNLMSASCEAGSESKAIADLNRQLDVLELCNYASDGDAAQSIYEIISDKKNSPLFDLTVGDFWQKIPDLKSIAGIQLSGQPDVPKHSHHNYFCVVQADGDNVGKTVSHPSLKDGDVQKISSQLVKFGVDAADLIENFGGLPIYAGGDDLLFIAPVIGKDGTHIFSLLDEIENKAFKGVQDTVNSLNLRDDKNIGIEASLSFGIAISYYKYPLYEAFESARHLLFNVAKDKEKFPYKKTVAWCLRKHSGGTFEAAFSLRDSVFKEQFGQLIKATTDDDTVSAVAHKLRQEEGLVNVVMSSGRTDRLDALFEKVLEFDKNKSAYFDAVKAIMPTLYKKVGEKDYIPVLYSLLRTAKFINGEDLRDE